MPPETFDVIVGVTGQTDEQNAIADVSQYLAYADQTDTFGHRGNVTDVNVYADADGPFAVKLQFTTTIENDDALKRFMDEMTTLARVESVERLDYVVA